LDLEYGTRNYIIENLLKRIRIIKILFVSLRPDF